jgi:rare lipoprotein A
MGTTQIKLDYLRPASLVGSDDRKLLATLRTDGSGAVLEGPGSLPVAVASADLSDTPRASGPGAPITAIASAVTAAAAPLIRPTTSVAYSAPASRSNLFTTVAYSDEAGSATAARAAPPIEPAVMRTQEDEQQAQASTTIIRTNASTRTTVPFAPLPPERPFDLGVTTLVKSSPGVISKPSPAEDEDEVIAPRPPVRPKQLATLFFAPERFGVAEAFTPGNPFEGLKPQTFVRLRAP